MVEATSESGITALFTVYTNTLITGLFTTEYAVVKDSRWPNDVTVILTNNGKIIGRGGKGGDAAKYIDFVLVPAENGENGGRAIKAEGNVIINNNGTISVGGGGAGGGGFENDAVFALGGGAGGGAPLGLKGIGGQTIVSGNIVPPVGGDGSDAIGFIGGIGGTPNQGGYYGGKGGDIGQNGEAGNINSIPFTGSPATAYGLAGVAGDYSIVGISNVTLNNTGTIIGATI